MASAFCVHSSLTSSASSLLTKSTASSQLTPAAARPQSSFFGAALPEAGLASGAISNTACKGSSTIRLPAIRARTAGASKTIEVEVDKPLGLTLGQKSGGGVIITAVDGGGNAAKAGLKAGDQVIYTSSFFGDELWPADKLGFTKTAIQAKPDSVYFVVSRGAEVDVKKLPKRPAPPRFGRKLTEAQKARATHICLDCGYVYTLTKPFDEQDCVQWNCRPYKVRSIHTFPTSPMMGWGTSNKGARSFYRLRVVFYGRYHRLDRKLGFLFLSILSSWDNTFFLV